MTYNDPRFGDSGGLERLNFLFCNNPINSFYEFLNL